MTSTVLNKVNDLLHLEYGVEEEDILDALRSNKNEIICYSFLGNKGDPQLGKLIDQLQVENGKLKARMNRKVF